jgi:predicted aconitase with swiveling domain
MSAGLQIDGKSLVHGCAQGPVLMLGDPLSFWGGFDSANGLVIDRFHPQHGACLSGRIVFMRRGRGSSSGASVLAEAIRLGTAPAALVLLEADAIIATGALVAQMLYQTDCPVVALANEADWNKWAALPRLTVEADAGAVRLIPPE